MKRHVLGTRASARRPGHGVPEQTESSHCVEGATNSASNCICSIGACASFKGHAPCNIWQRSRSENRESYRWQSHVAEGVAAAANMALEPTARWIASPPSRALLLVSCYSQPLSNSGGKLPGPRRRAGGAQAVVWRIAAGKGTLLSCTSWLIAAEQQNASTPDDWPKPCLQDGQQYRLLLFSPFPLFRSAFLTWQAALGLQSLELGRCSPCPS